jgi:5'-3' exonuclease
VPGIKQFFEMVYKEDLFRQGGATTILEHPRLEADDCIALSLKQFGTSRSICVITSDHDYLQLKLPNITLMTLAFKPVKSNSDNDAERDLKLKILMGDSSDNIPSVFPKCGLKTAQKCLDNEAFFSQKMNNDPKHQAQYALNQQLIDFNSIPVTYAAEFLATYF